MDHERIQQAERVGQLMERFYLLTSQQIERRARRSVGLTVPQFAALMAIGKFGPGVSMAAISRAIMSAPSTVTGIADRLDAMGLIERERPPDDRRTVLVQLTDAGKRVISKVEAEQNQDMITVLQEMESDRVEQFIARFSEFNDSVQISVENNLRDDLAASGSEEL